MEPDKVLISTHEGDDAVKLPDHMTIHCPDCGAEDQAPIAYAWTLDGNRIQLTVTITEDSAVAKHVLDRHLLADAPPAITDGEAAPVVTDDSGRTHVVSRPVPFDPASEPEEVGVPLAPEPPGSSSSPSGSSPASPTQVPPLLNPHEPDVHERLDLLLNN